MSTEVYVFADWEDFDEPALVGTLMSSMAKKKEHFSFSYDVDWLQSDFAQKIDPSLDLYSGEQHSDEGKNFRGFLDSCPDRWGRLLMQRREAMVAHQENRPSKVLNEVDYLLGVHDQYRSGALRFKRELDGEFIDNDEQFAAPPMSSLSELKYAAQQVEENNDTDDPAYLKWLDMLMHSGSSLGGERPKSNVIDDNGHLWIAKFPSGHDEYDIAAWEYVAYKLSIAAGVEMSECRIEKFGSRHYTFLTKRFDRTQESRLHFTSAMTQLEYYDGDGDYDASYLKIAEFLTNRGANTKKDLAQLWRRIIFNIAISNTYDHLRNHGFIYCNGGWALSPAYDVNPVTSSDGLHLSITESDNRLDYDLAMEVIGFFQLDTGQACQIKDEVLASVSRWETEASSIGITRSEQQQMRQAFNV